MKEMDFESSSRVNVSRQGRTIYFFSEVSDTSVMEAIKLLMQIQNECKKKPVIFVINSPGGSCYDGLALYDCLMACPCPIVTIGMGMVASMGFIIYLAGDRRLASVNTRFLNHQVSSEFGGKATDIKIQTIEINALEDAIVKLVSARTSIPESQIKKDVKAGDKYYDTKSALKKGIVHEIIPYADKTVVKETPAPEPKA